MLNTFLHRSCDAYISGDPTAPCQTNLDLILVLVAAVGAGVAFVDERAAMVGFLGAHLLATVLFVAFLEVPALVLSDPVVADVIVSRSLSAAIKYEFPFVLILSFLGAMAGVFLKERMEGKWKSASA